jgi:hypothetical protein
MQRAPFVVRALKLYIFFLTFGFLFGERERSALLALHALGNAAVCMLSLPGVTACLVNPAHCTDAIVHSTTHSAADARAAFVVIAMHAYHVVRFALTPSDRFHHALFIPVASVLGFLFEWGEHRQLVAFFVCGLPGMLDYTAICLFHTGVIAPDARRGVSLSG